MSCVKVFCVCLVILIAVCWTNSKSDKMAINTFESTDNRLILMRQSRHIKPSVILLKRRMRKLIKRRKLHFGRLKTTKSKMAATRMKDKLKRTQKDIKKLRKSLLKHRKTKNARLLKSASLQEVQASFKIHNFAQLRDLHERCKNIGCSQLCTPEVDNMATASRCHCHRGFYLDTKTNKTCLDINECNLKTTKCEYKCINTMGSYYCVCPPGKKLSYDKSTCMDINECFLNNNHGPCQDVCVNTEGSYSCGCDRFPGTRLSQDGHSCQDIDECTELTAGCSHQCFNVYNTFMCGCPDGMLLGDDYTNCIDINECLHEIGKLCAGKCINTIGSYFCLDEAHPNAKMDTCEQLTPTKEGYHLCNRSDSVKVIMKGITDREHFLNAPGTICTYHSSVHVAIRSHVCNDRAEWEAYPLTIIKNTTDTYY